MDVDVNATDMTAAVAIAKRNTPAEPLLDTQIMALPGGPPANGGRSRSAGVTTKAIGKTSPAVKRREKTLSLHLSFGHLLVETASGIDQATALGPINCDIRHYGTQVHKSLLISRL